MRKYLVKAALAATIAAPVVSHAAPVSPALQNAWSMARIGYFQTHMNYAETGTDQLSNGGQISGTLDTEKGTLHGLYLAGNHQGAHFGLKLEADYAGGNTAYNGHYLSTGAPATGTTQDKVMDLNVQLRYGFAFSQLPNLAIVPAVEAGIHLWNRKLPYNTEDYFNGQWMGELGVAYTFGAHIVVSGGFGIGRTLSPKMHSSLSGSTFDLGASSIHKEWIKAAYNLNDYLGVFAKFQNLKFKYKASSVNSAGYYEPDSTTKLNSISLGVSYRF